MTNERYNALENDPHGSITHEEAAEGWHWCHEFDLLLVGPGMGELQSCRCWPKEHPVYLTTPPSCDDSGDTTPF